MAKIKCIIYLSVYKVKIIILFYFIFYIKIEIKELFSSGTFHNRSNQSENILLIISKLIFSLVLLNMRYLNKTFLLTERSSSVYSDVIV